MPTQSVEDGKTMYNVSLVALEEAQGTLLEYERIGIARRVDPVRSVGPVHTGSITLPPAADPRSGEEAPRALPWAILSGPFRAKSVLPG